MWEDASAGAPAPVLPAPRRWEFCGCGGREGRGYTPQARPPMHMHKWAAVQRGRGGDARV